MSQETNGCVQFSKNSWHYKVADYVFPYVLDNKHRMMSLCPYLRMVIASIIAVPFMVVWNRFPYQVRNQAWLFQAELVFLACIVGGAFVMDYADSVNRDILPPFLELVGYGFFGGNAVGIIGGLILYGAWALKDNIKKRPKKEHRTRGLIKTYIGAKHEKICPCVEFVKD